MQTRQKVEQIKGCFSAVENPHNPHHEAVKDTKGYRLGQGKSWMGQAEDSILQICQLTELKQTKERYPNRFRGLYEFRRSCQKTWKSSIENGQQAKQSQRSSFSFKKTGLPQEVSVRQHSRHPHRFNELATESGKWNGKAGLECVDGRHPSSKTPVGVLWVYCPGHARVKGNDRADRLASRATITSGLLEDLKC